MFDKLQQLKELKKMRDEAMQIQRTLDSETIEVEKSGVRIKLTLAQRFISIEVNGKGEGDIVEAVNEAVKESQKEAAKKMQGISIFKSPLISFLELSIWLFPAYTDRAS